MSRAHDLGEAGDADAGHLALLPPRLHILAELVVAELVEGYVHGSRIIAAVVDPAGRRRIRELLRLDEVVHAELGLVEAKLEGRVRYKPFDEVARLGDAE